MERTINDAKIVYNEFKQFKNIFTTINKHEKIIFCGIDDGIKMYFSYDDCPYLLEGEFYVNSELSKWLSENNKIIVVKTSDLKEINSTLKKNCVKIRITDLSFSFIYLNKDTNEEVSKVFYNVNDSDTIKNILNKFNLIDSTLNRIFEISNNLIDDDILKVYLHNDSLTEEKSDEKILEIPTAKIETIFKADDLENKIRISEKNELNQKYVSFSSYSKSKCLKLTQLFKTI